MLGTAEAQAVALPGTTLLDGCYQCVLLDSGATAALAGQGYALYVKLDSAPRGRGSDDRVGQHDRDHRGSGWLNRPQLLLWNPHQSSDLQRHPGSSGARPVLLHLCRRWQGVHKIHRERHRRKPSGFVRCLQRGITPQAAAASIYPAGVAMQTTTAGGALIGVSQWSEIFYRVGNQGV